MLKNYAIFFFYFLRLPVGFEQEQETKKALRQSLTFAGRIDPHGQCHLFVVVFGLPGGPWYKKRKHPTYMQKQKKRRS